MNNELVVGSINLELVRKKVLSEMMTSSILFGESSQNVEDLEASNKLKNILAMYSHELVCDECMAGLVQNNGFISFVEESARIQMQKGRLQYLEGDKEESVAILSKRL